jgi:hypothetical protein
MGPGSAATSTGIGIFTDCGPARLLSRQVEFPAIARRDCCRDNLIVVDAPTWLLSRQLHSAPAMAPLTARRPGQTLTPTQHSHRTQCG